MKRTLSPSAVLSVAALPLAWAAGGGGAVPLSPNQPIPVRLAAGTIDYGATVKAAGNAPGLRPGATVKLVLVPALGEPRQLATVRTDRSRRWTAVLRPHLSGRIAAFAAGDGRAATAAGVGTPITLRTSLSIPGTVSTHGTRPELRGSLAPPGRVRVRLERRVGRTWRGIATTTSSAKGTFGFRLRSGDSSNMRVTAAARSGFGESNARPVRALRLRPAVASWYWLYGSPLACGGRLGRNQLGVAHKTLKCGTKVTVSFRGRTLVVPVVDRGPYIRGREWDLTGALAKRLGFTGVQTIWVAP